MLEQISTSIDQYILTEQSYTPTKQSNETRNMISLYNTSANWYISYIECINLTWYKTILLCTCNTKLCHIVESIFNTVPFNLFISMLQLVEIAVRTLVMEWFSWKSTNITITLTFITSSSYHKEHQYPCLVAISQSCFSVYFFCVWYWAIVNT